MKTLINCFTALCALLTGNLYAQYPFDSTFNMGTEAEYGFAYSSSSTTLLRVSNESYLAGYEGYGCFGPTYAVGTVDKVESHPGGQASVFDFADYQDTLFDFGRYSDHQYQDSANSGPGQKVLFLGYGRSFDSTGGSQIYVERRLSGWNNNLDSTFGAGGIVRLNFPLHYLETNALRVHADGRFVVSAVYGDQSFSPEDCILVRFLPDGGIDSSFSDDGIWAYPVIPGTTPIYIPDVQIQADGKYLVARNEHWVDSAEASVVLSRILPDGSVDASYGMGGSVRFEHEVAGWCTYLESMAILPDGGVVLAINYCDTASSNGYYGMFSRIVKLNEQGMVDPGFGTNGWFSIPPGLGIDHSYAKKVKAREDGMIVAAGSLSWVGSGDHFPMLLALKPDGTLYSGFNQTGIFHSTVRTEGISDFVFQDDGKVAYVESSYPWGEVTARIGRVILGPNLTSTAENDDEGFAMYPNPATQEVFLKLNRHAAVSIFALDGRLLRTSAAAFSHSIDLSGLAKGVYVVRAGNAVKRLVKE